MDGQALAVSDLVVRLTARNVKVTSVVIAADRGVDFQHVMEVMDAVRGTGIKDIGLATKTE